MVTRDSNFGDTTFATNRTQAAFVTCCMSNEALKCVYTNLQYVISDKLQRAFFRASWLDGRDGNFTHLVVYTQVGGV